MDGWITFGTKLETKEFDKQIEDLERKVNDLENLLSKTKPGIFNEREIEEINIELEKTRNKLVGLYQQKLKLQKSGGFTAMNNSLAEAVKKASRLALGIFGIRSAYLALRRASSDLATYDPQYATNLEYIRWVLTQAIAPVLRGIVTLVGTILQYIYAILNAWFGIGAKLDLSAESFQKMKAGASGVSKAVKQIKKDLLGFDEINRLTDQSSTGTSAGAVGVGIPDFELGGLKEQPEWLQWIIDNKDTIISALAGIAGAILSIKLGIEGIKALGVFGFIYSCINLVKELEKYLGKIDPILENNGTSFEEFGNIIKYIGLAVLSFGIIISSVATGIVGAVVLVTGVIIKYWNEIKGFLQGIIDWFTNLQEDATNWFLENLDSIGEKFGIVGQIIVGFVVEAFNWIVDIIKGAINIVIDVFDGLATGIKQIFDGIIMIFQGDIKNGFINIAKGIVNAVIGILNGLISGINAIVYPIRALIVGIGNVLGKSFTMDNIKIPKIPYVKTGAIINMPNRGTYIGGAIGGESGKERSNSINR